MKNIFIIIWKSLIVGAGYTISLLVGGMVVRLAGLNLPQVREAHTILMWTFLGGAITGLFLGPIAASISTSRSRHIVVWGSVIFFNLASVAIEGYFFAPDLIGDSLRGLILQQIPAAFIAGWVITVLFTSREIATSIAPPARSFLSWSWRFVVGALSYLVFYFLFGVLNYALVTRPYYETHAGGLNVPVLSTILTAELIRSVFITLSLLPFFLIVRTDKKRLILLSGLILFSLGGLVPLTMQANTLPLVLLSASAVEIFFQNFSTGTVAALLLGKFERRFPCPCYFKIKVTHPSWMRKFT